MATKLLLLGLLLNLLMVKDVHSVGVCYGQNGDGLPSERDVVSLYQRNGITKMRIYDPPFQPTLDALRGTNIEVMIGVRNDALQSLNDPNAANAWVRDNIQSYPDVRFKYIAVGNEVDPNKESRQYVGFVLPAMQNVYNAIRTAGLGDQIKVSTATYSGLLADSSPPSDGVFNDSVRGFIEPIIGFLAQNNLPMLANIYPYFSGPESNLPYALFTAPGPVVYDNGRQYSNLFDAILDAHYAAQARLGGSNVEIVVSESGWPSAEGSSVATVENAGTYYRNLIAHVSGTAGTPLKPGRSIETYLFAMFDENRKQGNPEEKHFGIFFPNQQPKYGQLNFN